MVELQILRAINSIKDHPILDEDYHTELIWDFEQDYYASSFNMGSTLTESWFFIKIKISKK